MKTLEQLAREAGFSVEDSGAINDGIETAADFSDCLARFRAAVLEEAALLCDAMEWPGRRHSDYIQGQNDMADKCAAAIREAAKQCT